MVIFLLIFTILFYNLNYCSCCKKKDISKEKNQKYIENEKENDKKLDEVIKNNKIYKKAIKTSKFSWNNNNCAIKTSLLNLMLFFDNCPELFEDIKKEENIKCKRAKKEALEIIKEIINIREKYLKGENLIKMEDFYKRCHDYQYKFYKEVKDEELEDITKLKNLVEEYIYLCDLVGFGYQLDNMLIYYSENNKELFNGEKKIFKEYRDEDLEESDFKEYRTDFTCGCRVLLLLKLLTKIVKDFFINEGNLLDRYTYKQKTFEIKKFNNNNENIILENIKNLEINDKIISIALSVEYGTTGHSCLIFKDNNSEKWYFDCCNNVIEIDFEDIKKKNFQKILDIWAKKCNSYHYKFRSISEILYKN